MQTIFRGLLVTPIQLAQMCWSPILSCRWQRRQQPQISPLCDMGRTQAGWFPVTVFRKKDSGFRDKLEDICFATDICKGCMRFPCQAEHFLKPPSVTSAGWVDLGSVQSGFVVEVHVPKLYDLKVHDFVEDSKGE